MTRSPTPGLIDGHAHLHAVENVEAVVSRALDAGVKRIAAVGMAPADNRFNLELADRFPGVILPAAGLHPWNVRPETEEQDVADLESLLAAHADRIAAIGEVGIDYKVKVKKPLQKRVFASVLELAVQYGKPVIIHSRFSHLRTFEMACSASVEKAVFHWYSGPLDVLSRIIDAGYQVSATPALAYSRAHQSAMAKAPVERILIETDAPTAYQGEVSDPGFLIRTLDLLSEIKNMPRHELAARVTRNAERFFSL